MSEIIRIRVEGIRKQVDALKSFVTEPKGVFETADQLVKNFRQTNRQTLQQLRIPRVLGGRRLLRR